MFNMIFSSLTFVFLFGTIKANGGLSVQDLPLAVVAGLAGGFFIADLLGNIIVYVAVSRVEWE